MNVEKIYKIIDLKVCDEAVDNSFSKVPFQSKELAKIYVKDLYINGKLGAEPVPLSAWSQEKKDEENNFLFDLYTIKGDPIISLQLKEVLVEKEEVEPVETSESKNNNARIYKNRSDQDLLNVKEMVEILETKGFNIIDELRYKSVRDELNVRSRLSEIEKEIKQLENDIYALELEKSTLINS